MFLGNNITVKKTWKDKFSLSLYNVSVRHYKRRFLFEYLYLKEDLADKIKKTNPKKNFQHVL